jgi:hypothetical protein
MMTRGCCFVFVIASLGACSGGSPPSGHGLACLVTSADEDEYVTSETRTRLRVLGAEESLPPPEAWARCSNQVPVEFVDDRGDHLWLAVSAQMDEVEQLPADLLLAADGGSLRIEQTRGWFTNTSLSVLDSQGQTMLALQGDALPTDNVSSVDVAEAGGSVPQPNLGCGNWSSDLSIAFQDDNGEHKLDNGERTELSINGVGLTAINLHSKDWGEASHCTDWPSSPQYNWVAFRSP